MSAQSRAAYTDTLQALEPVSYMVDATTIRYPSDLEKPRRTGALPVHSPFDANTFSVIRRVWGLDDSSEEERDGGRRKIWAEVWKACETRQLLTRQLRNWGLRGGRHAALCLQRGAHQRERSRKRCPPSGSRSKIQA